MSKLAWGTIDVDTTLGRVFFQQDWAYKWEFEAPETAWTYQEQLAFHTKVDRQIWSSWSNRVTLGVKGKHWMVTRFGRAGLRINFDIRWRTVKQTAQWSIRAVKTKRDDARSETVFPLRKSTLIVSDAEPHGVMNESKAKAYDFVSPPHEFGHMLGDLADEYYANSPHIRDKNSIMNIGRYLRARHMAEVLRQLGTMLPGCTFWVRDIR
ncbi:hypothetical protein [Polyangium mundeleinium]|uniref:Uncharacterized protein n=1 Tax=Polyangium mundeleinium TaxID=2995306 RepID=A0ABT5F768_9BACT|nr:hypothetical protein [Polyangium mundeleinium]MDC0749946.1 hypothetical protein [Polyangium mundeleinium]